MINDDAEQICRRVYEHASDEGVVIRPAGRSLVVAPPLVVSEAEIDLVCDRIRRALERELERA